MPEQKIKKLFSGNIGIEYGQFYIDIPELDEDDFLDPDGAFENQSNGICGASQSGKIFFVVGPQAGIASIEVDLCESEPEIDETYEEIVEVPFSRGTNEVALCEWGGGETYELEIPQGEYIVRYSILGMGLDYGDDSDWDAPVEGQKHLIQIWPSKQGQEKIVKVTSETATYWHKEWGNQ